MQAQIILYSCNLCCKTIQDSHWFFVYVLNSGKHTNGAQKNKQNYLNLIFSENLSEDREKIYSEGTHTNM